MSEINLAQDIYTDAQVQKMLRKDRTIKFEYIIRNQYNETIGSLTNASGSISYDSSQGIMRTCRIRAKSSELISLASVDNRIVPYFCILAPNKHWLKYPLGVFIINPSSILQNKTTYIEVEGYDLGEIANDVKLENTLTCHAGAVYTSLITQRVASLYDMYSVEVDETLTRPNDIEYEIGTSELDTINAMLNSINYYPLHFDENGKAIAEPYMFPEHRNVEMTYLADANSIIYDGISQSTDLFSIPNRFIRYTNDADSPMLRAVYTVEDANIPSSTTARGRIITDVQEVKDIATQGSLESFTRRAAVNASQQTEYLQFTTALMPGHGFKNCIHVRCEDAGIDDKYIEYAWDMDLSVGGRMTHQCYKAVSA